MVINGYWLSKHYQWLSRVINCYQLVISGYQWLLVINGCLGFLMVISKLSVVINGYWLHQVINGFQWLLMVSS